MTSLDKTYDWLYSETLKIYFHRTQRLIWLGIISLLAIGVTWRTTNSDDSWLLKMFIFTIWIYILVILFLILRSLLRSFDNKRVGECVCILKSNNITSKDIEKYKQRAATDAETAQTFMLLPILLLTLAVPGVFSVLSYIFSENVGSSSAENSISPIDIVKPFSTEEGSIVLTLVLVGLISVIFLVLYDQLERAYVSVVIQHACIEREAEIESQSRNSLPSALTKVVQFSLLTLLSSFLRRISRLFK